MSAQSGNAKIRVELDTAEALRQLQALQSSLGGPPGSGGGGGGVPGTSIRPPGGGGGGGGRMPSAGDVAAIASLLNMFKQVMGDVVGSAQKVREAMIQDALDVASPGIREATFNVGAVMQARQSAAQELGMAGAHMSDQQLRRIYEVKHMESSGTAKTALRLERMTRGDVEEAGGAAAKLWIGAELGYHAWRAFTGNAQRLK